jgi:hypothetical protein
MNKYIIFFFLLAISYTAKSQGNLQFNQVINLIPGANYTVPTGKVLKIESITTSSESSICLPLSSTSTGSCGGYSNQSISQYSAVSYLSIGNISYGVSGTSACGTSSCKSVPLVSPTLNLPIWLNESKTISIYTNVSQLLLTAIEFNVLP